MFHVKQFTAGALSRKRGELFHVKQFAEPGQPEKLFHVKQFSGGTQVRRAPLPDGRGSREIVSRETIFQSGGGYNFALPHLDPLDKSDSGQIDSLRCDRVDQPNVAR